MGVDLLHTKLSSTLSRPGAQAVADLLNRVEAERQWPARQQMLIYFLILKPNGKDRPIGLLPSLIRLWETIRVPYMRRSLRANPREWDCCSPGQSSEGAVWETLLAHEADGAAECGPKDKVTATVIMDLVKAFERVELVQVWHWGLSYGFPRALLAMVLT